MKLIYYPILCCLLIFSACMENRSKSCVSATLCRNQENPIGIDKATFSWKIESETPNTVQTAWEIEIASSKETLNKGKADVWSSGKRQSDDQLNIEPQGATMQTGHVYWWRVRIWDGEDLATAWSKPAYFSLGPAKDEWKAQWITATWQENSPLPYFRKTFKTDNEGIKIERATVYLSGLGCSDLFLNGERIDSTRILDPAQTNYEQYALYSTFDVTKQIKEGANCIGVMLGNGWYNQGVVWGKGFSYGNPIVLLQLEITYRNGTKQIIGTDESWQWMPGPILSSNIYAGETYDANKEIPDWSKAVTDGSDWNKAVLAKGANIPKSLFPQLMEPIRLNEVIDAVDMWQDKEGNWIFDFGVNIAGVPVITVEQPAGTRLKMRTGELLNENRAIDFSTTGVFATQVIQTEEYICTGKGIETWTPRFTYHGYRYLELSGAATKPELSWIKTALVYNDVKQNGTFECSEPQINRLHELAIRTMLSNTHGIPTDCPHREKCGWLGDAHAVAPFESIHFDLNQFWLKYLADIHSTSSVFLENTLHHKFHNSEFYFADKQPGIPFMISPGKRLCGVASPDWGTAVVQLPWYVYLYYGNREALELYYDEMKQWVDHIQALTEEDIVPYGLGDWCPPAGNQMIDCPIPLSSSAFHCLDANLVARAAEVLNKKDDAVKYKALAERLKEAFIKKFYDPANKTFGSQTANAMALSYGLYPTQDAQAISDATVENIKKHHDFLHVGIFGLGHIGAALSRYGNSQSAYDAFTKKGEYSFAYMWDNADATSLWEILPVSEASKNVCLQGNSSLNHPMQGVYDAWFYEDIAGIRPETPGYKVIRFEPTMTGPLDWAKATIETPYGTVMSDWKKIDGVLNWHITIPPNSAGKVFIPAGKELNINDQAADEKKAYHDLPSGSYKISIIPDVDPVAIPTEEEKVIAVKEVLKQGVDKAVQALSSESGFFNGDSLFTSLPKDIQNMLNNITKIPQGHNLVNNALEQVNTITGAVAEPVGAIFYAAIDSLSVIDVNHLLLSDSAAATHYLQQLVRAPLHTACEPIILQSLDKKMVGNITPRDTWNTLSDNYNKMAKSKVGEITKLQPIESEIDSVVTDKIIDAVFLLIAKEEMSIRKHPAARISKSVAKSFGWIDNSK